jgi:hypothetical protein
MERLGDVFGPEACPLLQAIVIGPSTCEFSESV